MLRLEGVGFGYGSVQICSDISLTIEEGEVVCLLGRNGMGKTTFLEGLMGMNTQKGGRILFDGQDISKYRSSKRAWLGMGLVPQGRRIFAEISVRDNLRLGTLASRSRFQPIPDVVFDYFPVLRERLNQKGQTLSGGEQQMLAIARALAGNPKIILLDEPSEGLAPLIVDAITELIRNLSQERGITILLAEQNLPFALTIVERGYILEKGRIVESGNVEELKGEQTVRDYLMA